MKDFDAESAAAYVRDLFAYVLDRADPGPAEVENWVGFLLEHQDPAELLRRFGLSDENRRRMQLGKADQAPFPSGHFYSPIVNVAEAELDAERLFGNRTPLAIDLNIDEQRRTFWSLARHLQTIPFSDEKTDALRYFYNNTSYAFGDAFGYWGMLNDKRPSRIIEVGSGFTSALALDAIDRLQLNTTCTFIDPHPDLLRNVAAPIDSRHQIIADRVQSVDPSIVTALQENDILFIDSSHVVKTGSDVHFELTELLPRLRPGVVVHFHDVFDKFEYPEVWVLNEKFSWNEVYFLQCFLSYNTQFEIIYFNDFFTRHYETDLEILPLQSRRRVKMNPGGGLWLRRV